MSNHEEVDFDALEREIDIDCQVGLGRQMLEINELMAALDDANNRCNQAFDELEAMLDRMESRDNRGSK